MGLAEVGHGPTSALAARQRRAASSAKTVGRRQKQPTRIDALFDGVDQVAVVRGSSSGFTVLALGGLLAPLAAVYLPVLGGFALVIAAVAGFGTAGWRQAGSDKPAVAGALSAVGAYLLVLPLVYLGTGELDAVQIALTFITAVVVGAASGEISARIAARGERA